MTKKPAKTLPPPAGALPEELEGLGSTEEDRPAPADPPVSESPCLPVPAAPPVPPIRPFSIDVPLADPEIGYIGLHVDVRLETHQAAILKRLARALTLSHATLANGRHVEGNGGAVRWLLEKLD